MLPKRFLPAALLCLAATAASADEVGCVTTTWKLVGANHRICVEAFHDTKVPGVTCHVSQARTGGLSGSFGLAQDPSQFSLILAASLAQPGIAPVLMVSGVMRREAVSVSIAWPKSVQIYGPGAFRSGSTSPSGVLAALRPRFAP